MARVTVEDCVLKVPNRFDLVMLASQRARDISAGAPLTLDRDNDKNPVVALREIADETVELETLAESMIKGLQRQVEIDEPEEETSDLEPAAFTEELVDQSLELSSLAAPIEGEASTPEPAEEETEKTEAPEAASSEPAADPAADPAAEPAGEPAGDPAAEIEDETPT